MTSIITQTLLARQTYRRDNADAAESTGVPMACWNSSLVPVSQPLFAASWHKPLFVLFAIVRAVFCILAFDTFAGAQYILRLSTMPHGHYLEPFPFPDTQMDSGCHVGVVLDGAIVLFLGGYLFGPFFCSVLSTPWGSGHMDKKAMSSQLRVIPSPWIRSVYHLSGHSTK